MKREILILLYMVAMGTFIISFIAFLSQLSIYFVTKITSENISISLMRLLYASIKIGVVGGSIGGVGTWLMHFFDQRYHK